jgi:tetratricopeptide (TPR) repeat protein
MSSSSGFAIVNRQFAMRLPVFILICTSLLQAQESPAQLLQQLSESARKSLEKQQLEAAESDLRRMAAVSLDQLGVIYDRLNDTKRAEAAYQGAARLSPATSLRALLGLGIVYLKTGRYDLGLETVQKILALEMLNPEARHLLGKLYFMKSQFDLAAQELQRAYQAEPENGRVAYTLALAYLMQKRLPEAQALFRNLTAKLGDTPELHVLLGRALRETFYTDEAIAEFRRALELNPRYPRAHHYIGMTYLATDDVGVFPQARKEFEAELAQHPEEGPAHLMLGILLIQSREYPQAISHLRKAVESQPNSPDPYCFLGQALSQAGNLAEAIPVLEKAIALTTDLSRNHYQIANTHFLLGQALRKVGRQEEAVVQLKRSQELKALKSRESVNPRLMSDQTGGEPAPTGMGPKVVSQMAKSEEPAVLLDTEPPDPQTRKALESAVPVYRSAAASAYYNLGRIETIRSNLKRAAEYLENAAFWNDALPDVYFNLGVTQFKLEQPAKAAASLLEALKRDPKKPQTMQLLANLVLTLVDQRLADDALPVIDALLKLNPRVPDLYLLRGRLFAQKGKWDDGLKALQQALALNPKLPDAHYYMGTLLIRQGEMDKAQVEFEKELALNPKHARALYHKAFILVSQRKLDQAIPLLETVIRLEPGYAEPYYQLGRAQTEGKDLLLGLANLETAAHLNPNAPYVFYQLARAYTKAQRRDDAAQALERYRELKKAEKQGAVPPPLESQ